MDGITLKTDCVNQIPISEECIAYVSWLPDQEAWYLDVHMHGVKGWGTLLTGRFKDMSRLEDVLATMHELSHVED